MSEFNTSEFNNIEFNAASGEIKTFSTSIMCNTNFSVLDYEVVKLLGEADVINGKTNVTRSSVNYITGLISTIETGTLITPNLSVTYSLSGIFDSSTSVREGFFLNADIIECNTLLSPDLSAIIILDSTNNGISNLNSTLNSIFTLSSDISGINGNTILEPILSIEYILDSDTNNGITNFSSEIDVFNLITIDPVINNSTTIFNGNMNIISSLNSDISCNTNISPDIKVDFNLGTILFDGETELFQPMDLGPADVFNGGTTVQSDLYNSDLVKFLGRNRRVSFVFNIEKPDIENQRIDRFIKLMKFYYSLSNVNQTLDYVGRVAVQELDSYDIDNPLHKTWSGDGNLNNLIKGDRGLVSANATGFFKGKDGQFGVYIGDNTSTN